MAGATAPLACTARRTAWRTGSRSSARTNGRRAKPMSGSNDEVPGSQLEGPALAARAGPRVRPGAAGGRDRGSAVDAADVRSAPLVLIDVDGVLNPTFSAAQRRRLAYHHGWLQRRAYVDGLALRVFVNPAHGAMLRRLARET